MTRQQRIGTAIAVVLGLGVGLYLLFDRGVKGTTVVEIAAFALAVIFHEVSHGVAALACGDDTAKRAGRITLNPISHVDPFGTVILPAMLALSSGGSVVLGYAKPVPVNPRRMRSPRNHQLLVSLAGPGTNIAFAVLAAVVYRLSGLPRDLEHLGTAFLIGFGYYNVILAVFNLIPVPPLDGSAMVERVLPMRWWEPYLRLRQYSILLLFAVVFWLPTDRLFLRAVDWWARTLL